MKYRLIEDSTLQGFEDKVTAALNAGGVLVGELKIHKIGNPPYTRTFYAQAVVTLDKVKDDPKRPIMVNSLSAIHRVEGVTTP